jgi:hypothetical protein
MTRLPSTPLLLRSDPNSKKPIFNEALHNTKEKGPLKSAGLFAFI